MDWKLSDEEKKYLLEISRKSLIEFFNSGKRYVVKEKNVPEKFRKNAATFVTLTINGELRGCIGMLEAVQPLYKDVLENTYHAAFNDGRFEPLSPDELKDVKIEISILTEPKPLEYLNKEDLLEKLEKNKPGLILKMAVYQATFLPQVWDELNDPIIFLEQLSLKAGLNADDWKNKNPQFFWYEVVNFKEGLD